MEPETKRIIHAIVEKKPIFKESQLATIKGNKLKRTIAFRQSCFDVSRVDVTRLELKANEIRKESDPEYVNNNFKTYSWWFFAIMSLLAAICNNCLSRNSNQRKPVL